MTSTAIGQRVSTAHRAPAVIWPTMERSASSSSAFGSCRARIIAPSSAASRLNAVIRPNIQAKSAMLSSSPASSARRS